MRNNLLIARLFCAVMLSATAVDSPAQTFKTLVAFDGANGLAPSGLVQGTDGNLYGTTFSYGPNGAGTAFKVTPVGELTTIHSFCSETNCEDGALPAEVPLTLGTNGNLYGGTLDWGANGVGTIFSMTEAGQLTTLYDVGPLTGPVYPDASPVQLGDGSFYGTSSAGGTTCGSPGCGTFFKMSPAGVVTTLYSFCSQDQRGNCLDGQSPANPLFASSGHFYGTTAGGGKFERGTIFEITPTGKFNTLYDFCSQTKCADGASPTSLIQGTDGNLYGTASAGGAFDEGTVFRVTTKGTLATLYNFCSVGCLDGYQPEALIEGSDGNFYGVAQSGGVESDGTIFQLMPSGNFTTIHTFVGTDGKGPIGLMQGTNGNFYGATVGGGGGSAGTVFGLSMGLGPFVKFVRGFGKVGQSGGILGQGFTGTTGVFLNGTPAEFTVVSGTYIQVTVPPGATTGYVTVDTPSGTLKSNVMFRVIR